ncbi:MAG: hypothetical protein LC797_13705 [Chloroflexi bacterium]|nr:hypothetical protein [Chloroflexota bacterium]
MALFARITVVKFEHREILDAAVHAGTACKVIAQLLSIAITVTGVVLRGALLIGFRIAEVVRPRDCAHTDPTDSHAFIPVRKLQSEAGNSQNLTTPAALFCVFKGGRTHSRL